MEEGDDSAFDAWVLPGAGEPPPHVRELSGDAGVSGQPSLRWLDFSTEEMGALCGELRAARQGLLERKVSELAETLGRVGARFLDADDPLRKEALERLPPSAGISPAMALEVLEGMARDWLPDRLRMLLDLEFDDPKVLDGFLGSIPEPARPEPAKGVSAPGGEPSTPPRTPTRARRLRALGPALTLHLGAGNVPGVSVTSLIRGLLVKSAVLLKPGRADAVLPVLFARGLAEEDPEIASAVAVVYWPGGSGQAEAEALRSADLVVAYGGEEAIRAIRDRLPVSTRFVPYHHRISFGVVAREAASKEGAPHVARAAAHAAALFDRRGCVSPHLFYVEEGGEVTPQSWAHLLAEALREEEAALPSGEPSPAEASEIHQFRGTMEMAAAAGRGIEIHRDEGVKWTVIYDPDPAFEASCPGRTVRVKPVGRLEEIVDRVRPYGSVLQTVGFAGPEGAGPEDAESSGRRLDEFAEAMGRVGAFRITSFERLPWPPPWWHHDGTGPLRALVRWVEVEGEER